MLFLLVLFALAWILAFSLMPQYLVFHKDGVEMVVPSLQENGLGYQVTEKTPPAAYVGDASASVQIAAPDYTDVALGSAAGLDYLQGLYVPYSKANSTGLQSAVKDAERRGIQGLVLQLKDESGQLAWMSEVAYSSSYATNGTWDLTAEISELKAEGWYLVAQISCAVDTALAQRNPAVALKDAMGAPYTDETGGWVDLWNAEVRSYIAELTADLMNKGFDEVILDRVEHPLATVTYTRNIPPQLDQTVCVTNFGIAVRESVADVMEEQGAHLCAVLSHDALEGTALSNGQSLTNFLKVFDRVVITTYSYSEDAKVFVEAKIDSTLRFVPRMDWIFSGGSWILDTQMPAQDEEG